MCANTSGPCVVAAANSAPHQQPLDSGNDNKLLTVAGPSSADSGAASGQENNDKVLTLAEQFLAAMPDRIKLDGGNGSGNIGIVGIGGGLGPFQFGMGGSIGGAGSSTASMDMDDDESMDCYECCSAVGGLDCMSDDLGIESMADDQSVDFNFEEACHR